MPSMTKTALYVMIGSVVLVHYLESWLFFRAIGGGMNSESYLQQ